MAQAFAMYAGSETSTVIRARTSPSRVVGVSAAERWATLPRWIEAARRGVVFGVAGLGGLGRRRVAELVVLALAARAGHRFGDNLAENAFAGAAIAG